MTLRFFWNPLNPFTTGKMSQLVYMFNSEASSLNWTVSFCCMYYQAQKWQQVHSRRKALIICLISWWIQIDSQTFSLSVTIGEAAIVKLLHFQWKSLSYNHNTPIKYPHNNTDKWCIAILDILKQTYHDYYFGNLNELT